MPRKYLFVFGVVVILVGLISTSTALQEIFLAGAGEASKWADSEPVQAVLLFVSLAMLSALISPFSTIPLVPVAASLWGVTVTTGLLLGGWLVGDTLAYFIGKYGGNTMLKQFFAEQKLRKYEAYLSSYMTFVRALIIRIALPAEVGYGFGIIRYSFWRYLIVTAIAEGIFAVISVRAADALMSLDLSGFSVWVSLLIAIVGAFYYLSRRGLTQ